MASIVFNWRLLALVMLDWTNFYKFYGGFEDISLTYLVSFFHWLYKFGLDVFRDDQIRI